LGKLARSACIAASIALLLAAAPPAGAATDDTTLVSRAASPWGPKGNGSSREAEISADGRYVAFRSAASNLHPDDPDTTNDVFVRDLVADTTTLVSRAATATGAKGNGASDMPSISADGRYVAFRSAASNLHPDDPDITADVFVRDLVANTTTLVSRAATATGAKGNGASFAPSISADGHCVAFSSLASNLHPDDPDTTTDVFVRALLADTTTLVSRAATATGAKGYGASGLSGKPSISADGHYVTFASGASNLHPDDPDTTFDVFVRDLLADTTTLVSRAATATGAKGNGNSFGAAISADGHYVAFSSDASNLHPDDADTTTDVFVRDLLADTTTLVSRAATATGAKGNGNSDDPSISADGRYVPFSSVASNLHPDDTDATTDVFVRDVLGPQPPVELSSNDVRAKEGKSGTKLFTFTVTLDGVPGRTVTVDFATKNDTATVGDNDYEFTNGTLTFLPGETTKQVPVTVNGDKKRERSEIFKVKIFNATAEIEDGTGIGTIRNDDR
jgi:Tol biopolymer transport system component